MRIIDITQELFSKADILLLGNESQTKEKGISLGKNGNNDKKNK